MTSRNVSRSTNQQRTGAHQQGPVRQLATEEEEGEEEEGEEEDDFNNVGLGRREEDENEDLRLARDVLRASDKFKDHRMWQAL